MLIILSQFVNEMTAIIISFPMLLFIGEIIPKALFTGPKQLQIASIFVPFTSFLIRVSYPISYPISIFMHSISFVPIIVWAGTYILFKFEHPLNIEPISVTLLVLKLLKSKLIKLLQL